MRCRWTGRRADGGAGGKSTMGQINEELDPANSVPVPCPAQNAPARDPSVFTRGTVQAKATAINVAGHSGGCCHLPATSRGHHRQTDTTQDTLPQCLPVRPQWHSGTRPRPPPTPSPINQYPVSQSSPAARQPDSPECQGPDPHVLPVRKTRYFRNSMLLPASQAPCLGPNGTSRGSSPSPCLGSADATAPGNADSTSCEDLGNGEHGRSAGYWMARGADRERLAGQGEGYCTSDQREERHRHQPKHSTCRTAPDTEGCIEHPHAIIR